MSDNTNLHNEVKQIKARYKEKEFDIEQKSKSKIKSLEKETNIFLDTEKQLVNEKKGKELEMERQENKHNVFTKYNESDIIL